MRSLTIIGFLGLVALGWAPASQAAPQAESPYSSLESAKVNWRWIGIRHKGASCPRIPGWRSRSWLEEVFSNPRDGDVQGYGYEKESPEPATREAVPRDPLLHKLKFDRFCSYEYNSGGSPPPLPLTGLVHAEKARMALVPAGMLEDQTWGTLADHFRTQVIGTKKGKASIEGWRVPFTGSQRVRLVFVDTQKDSDDVPLSSSPSRHGFTLAHMAKQLICRDAGPSCPVTVATRLALARPRFDPDDPARSAASSEGGYLGTVDELARVIVQAVSEWRQSHSTEKLILNLSVGWDAELLDQIDGCRVRQMDAWRVSQLDPSAQLVYEALRYARRSGALVIAAAGNRRGGEQSNWPVLPAAWELRRPTWFHLPFGRKRVYAVGGVDWQGLPLPNARVGGMPRRVAFGDHAVAKIWRTEEPTATYTGSSVSAAVASSIAAVVWQLRPELTPSQVMRLISRSGDPLPGQADFYPLRDLWPFSHLAPLMGKMRELSLCSAVAQACRQGREKPCDLVCPSRKDEAADLSMLASLPSVDAVSPLFKSEATLPPACRQACDPEPRLFTLGANLGTASMSPVEPARACPLYLLPDRISQHWVRPQPDDPPCLSCSMIPPRNTQVASMAEVVGDQNQDQDGYILAVELAPEWHSVTILSASLDVNLYSGGRFVGRTTYTLPEDELATGRLLRFSIKGDEASLEGCTATLNLEVNLDGKKVSVQNPVYVDPL